MSTTTTADTAAHTAYADHLRREIARHEAACGCELGSAFTLAGLVLFVGRVTLDDSGWSAAGTAGRGLAWVVACSLVGKLLGLTWARLRIIHLRARLRSHLNHPSPRQEPKPTFGKD